MSVLPGKLCVLLLLALTMVLVVECATGDIDESVDADEPNVRH